MSQKVCIAGRGGGIAYRHTKVIKAKVKAKPNMESPRLPLFCLR